MIKISVHVHVDGIKLQLLEVIGQGSFGTVRVASWRGSLIAAKVVPVQVSEAASLAAEIDILRYVLLSEMFSHYYYSKLQHPNLRSLLGVQNVNKNNGIAILSLLIRGSNPRDHIFGATRRVCWINWDVIYDNILYNLIVHLSLTSQYKYVRL